MDCDNTLIDVIESCCILKDGRLSPQAARSLKKQHPMVFSAIVDRTAFLGAEASFALRYYCIRHNITSHPVCSVCGRHTRYDVGIGGFREYCSIKCMAGASSTIVKRRSTNIQRYGASCPSNSVEGQEKRKLTWINKYGVDHPCRNSDIQTARLSRSSPVARKASAKKYYDTHGYWPAHTRIPKESLEVLRSKSDMLRMHADDKMSACAIADMLHVAPSTALRWLKRHSIDVQTVNISSHEHDIVRWLVDNNIHHVRQDRKLLDGMEIDIYIPDKKIGIEVCGTYWHSETYKTRTYHLDKLNLAESKGIRLIQLFDYELLGKRDIVFERLTSILQIGKPQFQARKLTIKQIESSCERAFLDAHHIQGYVPSKVCYGAYMGELLVGVMSFGRPRYNKNHNWELLRYSTIGCTGLPSRLFTRFVREFEPTTVISYSDRRWNTGGVYKSLGMSLKGVTSPGYVYFHVNQSTKVYHRSTFQKHKLHTLLPSFDPNKSEYENMLSNGYDRTWDCGQLVFVWENTYDKYSNAS